MQWWTKLIFTAVNILHIWIWEVIVVRKIQKQDHDGWEVSLVMSVAGVPSCPITKTNIDGKERGGWSLVMCGPDSSGALSPSLIIYPPSTSLSLDKNGVQGNPVNFPKLSGNFNNEE